MRIIIALFSILLTISTVMYSQTTSDVCAEHGNKVRVTAQQLRKDPPSYTFLITNLTDSPIVSFIIGEGEEPWLRIISGNIPTSMESPNGWKGLHIFRHESIYMYYLWQRKDPTKSILPQKSACGFRINLPTTAGQKMRLFGPKGKEAVQVDFRYIPFRVQLANNTNYCGIVKVDFIDRF